MTGSEIVLYVMAYLTVSTIASLLFGALVARDETDEAWRNRR